MGIILKKFGRKKTFFAKDRIQGCDTMALAQDKPVSFRISSFIRTYIQEAPVKGDEQIDEGKRASQVRGAGLLGKLNHATANTRCDGSKILVVTRVFLGLFDGVYGYVCGG